MLFDVDRFLSGHPLCITEAGLEELRAHIAARIALFNANPREAMAEVIAASQERDRQASARHRAGKVGVIQIRGTISQHADKDASAATVGGTATETISAQLQEFLADDEIGKIVLDIDSPGGSCYGVAELAREIRQARGTKPIVAVANSMAASAAYWIATQADHLFVTPGGLVGSVGAYSVHQDISSAAEKAGVKTTLISAGKYKTRGNQFEPLDGEALAAIQERVDYVYDQFVADVARGRGTTEGRVKAGFGEGDVVNPKKARAEGMVDGIATLEQVIARSFKPRGAALSDEDETAALEWQDMGAVTRGPAGYVVVTVDEEPEPEPDEEDPPTDQTDNPTPDESSARTARLSRMRMRMAAAAAMGE